MNARHFAGGCHCGNLSYVFEASTELGALGLRACTCSFCRAHAARYTSDPDGAMRIVVRDAAKLERYRFGLNTADFLLCRACGVYIGAFLPDEKGCRFVVNVNTFHQVPALEGTVEQHDFGGEDFAARVARRSARWTPVVEFRLPPEIQYPSSPAR